jgi:hypothetical protein
MVELSLDCSNFVRSDEVALVINCISGTEKYARAVFRVLCRSLDSSIAFTKMSPRLFFGAGGRLGMWGHVRVLTVARDFLGELISPLGPL